MVFKIPNIILALTIIQVIPTVIADTKNLPDQIQVPDYAGQKYKVTVPDTLDIAERCGLAVHGLTSATDSNNGYMQYFYVAFGREPSYMKDVWQPGCTPKFIESLPYQRVASGNLMNSECEKQWINYIIKSQQINGRIIGAAGLYYKLTDNEKFKQAGIKMIEKLKSQLTYKDNYAFLARPEHISGTKSIDDPIADYDTAIWLIDGLVRFYRMTKYESALELAGQLSHSFMQKECFYFTPDSSFVDAPLMWPGVKNKQHFHLNTLLRLSLAEYGELSKDREILQWVQKGYEFGKAHGEPVTGWFPEALKKQVNAVYNISEICAVADMIAIALKLTNAGVADYWDDADRWIRNMLAEGQLRDTSWLKRYFTTPYCRVATLYDADHIYPGKSFIDYIKDRFPDSTTENVALRNIGNFGGWIAMNDWFGGYNINAEGMQGPAIMQCCSGNGSRTLYAAFYNILKYDVTSNELKINLLLNRASKWADIMSHIPYTGRVDVKIKEPLNLSIRIPHWVGLDTVRLFLDGKLKENAFSGPYSSRYLKVGRVIKGQTVTVIFPVTIQQKTVRVRYYEPKFSIEESYILTIKGNTVIDISPKGKRHPLYQRSKYYQNKTLYKTVNRFVSNKILNW